MIFKMLVICGGMCMNYCELILRLSLGIFNSRTFNEYPEVLIQKLYDSAVCFLSSLLLIESFQKPGTFFLSLMSKLFLP